MPKILKMSMQCPLQYLKNEADVDEADVLHADRHESLLLVDNIIFDGFGQGSPKYPVSL